VATRSKKSAAITSPIPTLPPMQLDVEPSKLPSDVNSPRGEYVDNGNDDNDNNNYDDNDNDDSKDPDYKGIDDYDKDNDDNDLDDDVDDDDGGGKCGPGEKPSMRVKPGQGLYYRDDDALLDEIFDDEYDEMHFTSIQLEAACDRNRNRIAGGPQRPDNPSKLDERSYKVN
jgi:hypothetical protein